MAEHKRIGKANEGSGSAAEAELIIPVKDEFSGLSLDSAIKNQIKQLITFHVAGAKAQAMAVIWAMNCGHKLQTLKTDVGHGRFGRVCKILETHHGISERTIQRYMQLAENKEDIINRIRELNPTRKTGLPDEEVLAGTSIAQALRLIAEGREKEEEEEEEGRTTSSGQEKTTTPVKKKKARPAKFRDCHLPSGFSEALKVVWNQLDVFISDVDEAVEIPTGSSNPAARALQDQEKPEGHVLLNCLRKSVPSELLETVAKAFSTKAVTEAFIAVPCGTEAEALSLFQACPRLILRKRPRLERLGSINEEQSIFPCSVMVLVLADPKRYGEIATAFHDVADLYVPFVSAT